MPGQVTSEFASIQSMDTRKSLGAGGGFLAVEGTERRNQRVRLRHWTWALGTYAGAILVAFLVGRIGLGAMSGAQWALFLGSGTVINLGFFGLFRSNFNLRFQDPSLTIAQLLVGSMWGMIPLYCLPGARPLVLMLYLPSFCFGMLRLTNRQYLGLVTLVLAEYVALLVVEYGIGRRAFYPGYEAFVFGLFGLLLIWFALFGGMVSKLRLKLHEQLQSTKRVLDELRVEVQAREAAKVERERLVAELQQSLADVRKLGGLLPICAACKKIRDDQGYWNQIEAFITDRSEAKFSHGICPDCAERLYPGQIRKQDPGTA